jgi:hypothetical protein
MSSYRYWQEAYSHLLLTSIDHLQAGVSKFDIIE